MSETLYNIAVSNLGCTKKLLQLLGDDPRELNICGYHIQQAAELCLKFILEESGIEYPKTHEIEVLLTHVEQQTSFMFEDYELEERLQLFAGTLTSWEAKTRYIKDWFLELKSVCTGFRLVSSLLHVTAEWSGQEIIELEIPTNVIAMLKPKKTNPSRQLSLDGDHI